MDGSLGTVDTCVDEPFFLALHLRKALCVYLGTIGPEEG